jgi:hypothetical protein
MKSSVSEASYIVPWRAIIYFRRIQISTTNCINERGPFVTLDATNMDTSISLNTSLGAADFIGIWMNVLSTERHPSKRSSKSHQLFSRDRKDKKKTQLLSVSVVVSTL